MKIFKSTNNNITFINQLLDVINSNTMRSIINKYSGDYRSQSFDTYSHFFKSDLDNLVSTINELNQENKNITNISFILYIVHFIPVLFLLL